MKNVYIIGGGASAFVAAITRAKNNEKVTILERNSSCLKKLLMTGNGRCNYWNQDMSLEHYHSSHMELLNSIMTDENKREVLLFFDTLGLVGKEKNGCYYPSSNQAKSVYQLLLTEAKKEGVDIKTNILVTDITHKKDKFYITTTNGVFISDEVIIATGSMACPITGSDGMGYSFATTLGHSFVPVVPSLVQLVGNKKKYSWNGARTDVTLKLYEDNIFLKEEKGEIQLTEYGISGICTFNLSGIVAEGLYHNKKEMISINFVPWYQGEDFLSWLIEQAKKLKERTVFELLTGFLNDRIIQYILQEVKIDYDKDFLKLDRTYQEKLATYLSSYPFVITKTKSFDQAQVCRGGIPLTEINVKTMESNIVSGLYFTGEILDVDGECGGYNLGFAWVSGLLCGKKGLE